MPNSHRSMIAGTYWQTVNATVSQGAKSESLSMFRHLVRILADRSLLDPGAALSPLGHFYYYVGDLELRMN